MSQALEGVRAESTTLQAKTTPYARADRLGYVDVFRGFLIAHMALDHASLMFNAGRGGEELAVLEPASPIHFGQFLTRFTGVPVAPAFCLMAGFMVALTSAAREARGVARAEVTRRLLMRGLVLVLVDALVLGIPRAASGFYSFMVLSSIGVSLWLLAAIRDQKTRVLLPIALAVLALHPLLDLSALPVALRAILHDPVRTGAFRSLYPLIPWSAFLVLGFVLGRDSIRRERPVRFWAALGALSLVAFFTLRLKGGYGNAYPHSNPAELGFWSFSKYPPDLAFTTWALAITLFTLAAVRLLTQNGIPALLRPLAVFGRVPFFFYVVHFYVLGIVMALLRTKFGLLGTYAVWFGLLLAMLWPCAWYYRKKRDRPNFITRYL